MAKTIDVRSFDTAYGKIELTLDYDPAFIFILKKYEKGNEIVKDAVEASASYLSIVRENIINYYLKAKYPRAITGNNELVNRTGTMAKSLYVRKNIAEDNADKNYTALMVRSSATNRRTGVSYPIVLETGWRGRTKMKSEDYNTSQFVPPFYYTLNSFERDIDRFGKYLLRNINATTKKMFNDYMKGNIQKGS